jgi:ATP-binding cassette subfamily C (CFTR/MRP) protein 1
MVTCDISYDNDFGPIVDGCRSSFDFTLLFEQSILSIGPAALLLVFAPYQLIRLSQVPRKLLPKRGVRTGALKYVSLRLLARWSLLMFVKVFAALLLNVQIALLVLWTLDPITNAAVPAAALSFLAAIAVFLLSVIEHSRAVRPSTSLILYLLATVTTDAVQARTLFLRHENSTLACLSAVLIGLKLCLLLLEAKSKRRFLRSPYRAYPPEATSSIINRSFFWWLNPIFALGLRRILTLDDLFSIDEKLSSRLLRSQMKISWNICKQLIYSFLTLYARPDIGIGDGGHPNKNAL